VSLVLPELKGKCDGMALRVPTPDVSLVDLTATLARSATAEDVNNAMREAAAGPLQGPLAVSEERPVSVDFLHDSHSTILDALLTMVLGDHTVKVSPGMTTSGATPAV